MNVVSIGMRNIWRSPTRTVLTVLGGAVAVLAFVLIRTILLMWDEGVDNASVDRLATRHKVSFILPLPKRYVDVVRNVPGVRAATWMTWFGGRNPRDPDAFFPTIAMDGPSALQVYDEIELAPDQKARWLADRKGAIVGDQLAKKLGLSVGDTFTLTGTIFPGDWPFTIDGVYTTHKPGADRGQFYFHYDYLNESLPEWRRDQIGWIVSRVDSPSRSADLSAAIDRMFDDRDVQTATMTERALSLSWMAGLSAVVAGLSFVSVVILAIMTLIIGNTIAMGVRERTREYGVFRALGFAPHHVGAFVLAEAFALGALGGAMGLVFAYPLIVEVIGRWVRENMGAMFPRFELEPRMALASLLVAALLAVASALLPAWRVSRLKVVDALRHVG
jgi:putative ABC transport system permease protein